MPTDNLGAWAGDDLKSTYRTYEGVGYYSGKEASTQFAHGIAKIIRKRLAGEEKECEKGHPSLFILGSLPTEHKGNATFIPQLYAGKSQLAGHVWFMAREPVVGYGLKVKYDEFKQLINFVAIDLKSGKLPTIYFDAKTDKRSAIFFPEGLEKNEIYLKFPIDGSDISPESVKNALDRVYQSRLITPDASAFHIKLWEDKDKCWPIATPETTIQSYIATGLTSSFVCCRIKEEQTGMAGRYDIAIVEQNAINPSEWIHHAILELKVIKSFGSTGSSISAKANEDWLSSGLDQASSYQKENGSRFAAICCFDMQMNDNKDSCFDHVRDKAKSLVVELWRWYLYATSEAFRKATATAKSSGLPENK